ncbi:MAG: hypothetical protein IKS14_02955, partial [Thermoguttaceae bacterium]|nr:hypothetical protein [Thermoguttaceae bacterium]
PHNQILYQRLSADRLKVREKKRPNGSNITELSGRKSQPAKQAGVYLRILAASSFSKNFFGKFLKNLFYAATEAFVCL